jgi:hypothetical protein
MSDLEQSKYQVRARNVVIYSQRLSLTLTHPTQHVEWRISIYARNVNEWDKLAKWVVNNKLFSHVRHSASLPSQDRLRHPITDLRPPLPTERPLCVQARHLATGRALADSAHLLVDLGRAHPGAPAVRYLQGPGSRRQLPGHRPQYVLEIGDRPEWREVGSADDPSSRADLFQPLFEVTKDPKSHPELHIFLQRVIGFDS